MVGLFSVFVYLLGYCFKLITFVVIVLSDFGFAFNTVGLFFWVSVNNLINGITY